MARSTRGRKKSKERKHGNRKEIIKKRKICISVAAIVLFCGTFFTIGGAILHSSQSAAPSNGTSLAISSVLPSTTDTDDSSVTFDRNKYPPLASKPRPHIVNVSEPTFEIESARLSMYFLGVNPKVAYGTTNVAFVLNVVKRTEKLFLHCAVSYIAEIDMIFDNGMPMETLERLLCDHKTQLLILNLAKPVDKGKITIKMQYTPSDVALDKFNYPCDQKTCSVFAVHHLHFLVPHFGKLKHTWDLKISYPPGVLVLTNSKANKTEPFNQNIFITFDRTQPLLPNELTFVITDNLVPSSNGTQVVSYIPKGTQMGQVRGLVDTLEKALSSSKASSGELYHIVFVPAMESHRFYGRNLVIVGEDMLMSNEENKLIFAWIWVFRMAIYKKVTTSDTNPTWIYDHSAYFLATSTKSQNPDIWRKHFYEIAFEVDHGEMKQSKAYQDETRYFATHEHMAKISTLLSMMTTMDGTTSGNILANMDGARDTTSSEIFFFLKKKYDTFMVDDFVSPYLDSPDLPQVGIIRLSKSRVLIQRYPGEQALRCDIHLSLEEGSKKEQKTLAAGVEKMEIEANSPLLLTGKSPFSSYGYAIQQSQFNKLQDSSVLDSFDLQTLNLLASNAFREAFDGRLTYASLQRFIARSLSRKAVSVDEVIDLWSFTIRQSRDGHLESLIRKVVESTVKMAGSASGHDATDYILKRFDSSVQKDPEFMIEKAKKLLKDCGDVCLQQVVQKYPDATKCVDGSAKDCTYNPHVLEMYTCAKVAVGPPADYDHFVNLYNKCKGKGCQMPVLRGLLCTKDREKLQNHLNTAITFGKAVSKDVVERQVVEATFEGLASNYMTKRLLLDYLVDKWPQLYEMFYSDPAFLGNIVNTLASTVNTREQLNEYKQFLQAYKETVAMFRELQEQATKAKKVLKWHAKFSKEFESSFTIDPLSQDTQTEAEQDLDAEESHDFGSLSFLAGLDPWWCYGCIIIGFVIILLGMGMIIYAVFNLQ